MISRFRYAVVALGVLVGIAVPLVAGYLLSTLVGVAIAVPVLVALLIALLGWRSAARYEMELPPEHYRRREEVEEQAAADQTWGDVLRDTKAAAPERTDEIDDVAESPSVEVGEGWRLSLRPPPMPPRRYANVVLTDGETYRTARTCSAPLDSGATGTPSSC